MDRLRWIGIGLFLFIPLVLILFTRPPFGITPGWALLMGVTIIALHRVIARPWVFRNAGSRSLWSGATLQKASDALRVTSGEQEVSFALQDEVEGLRARRFAAYVCKVRPLLLAGIFLPLLTLLISVASQSIAGEELLSNQRAWTLLIFRGVIALTVEGSPPPG